MKKAYFVIDEWITAEGIHDPSETWNGWAVPFFTLEEVAKIAKIVDENCNPAEQWESVAIRDGKVFTEYHGFEEGEDTAEEVATIKHEGVTYYGVGGWSWCWDVDPDSEPCEECGAKMTYTEGENIHGGWVMAGWVHEHNPQAD